MVTIQFIGAHLSLYCIAVLLAFIITISIENKKRILNSRTNFFPSVKKYKLEFSISGTIILLILFAVIADHDYLPLFGSIIGVLASLLGILIKSNLDHTEAIRQVRPFFNVSIASYMADQKDKYLTYDMQIPESKNSQVELQKKIISEYIEYFGRWNKTLMIQLLPPQPAFDVTISFKYKLQKSKSAPWSDFTKPTITFIHWIDFNNNLCWHLPRDLQQIAVDPNGDYCLSFEVCGQSQVKEWFYYEYTLQKSQSQAIGSDKVESFEPNVSSFSLSDRPQLSKKSRSDVRYFNIFNPRDLVEEIRSYLINLSLAITSTVFPSVDSPYQEKSLVERVDHVFKGFDTDGIIRNFESDPYAQGFRNFGNFLASFFSTEESLKSWNTHVHELKKSLSVHRRNSIKKIADPDTDLFNQIQKKIEDLAADIARQMAGSKSSD